MRKKFKKIVFNAVKKPDSGFFYKTAKKYILVSFSILSNKPLTGPLLGIICPTYRCNLRCEMCNFWKKRIQKELTKKEIFRVIDDFTAMDTPMISFSGGEPFLRNDIFELINYAKKNASVHIATNGTLLTKYKAERLREIGVDAISVSLDSVDPKIHDRIRGEGSFQRTLAGLKNLSKVCKNSSTSVDIVSLIADANIHQIPKIATIFKDIEIDTFGVIPLHSINNNNFSLTNKPKTIDVNWLIDQLIMLKKEPGIIDNSFNYLEEIRNYFKKKDRTLPCSSGFTTCVVDASGDVFPCYGFYEMSKKISNIREKNLMDIWFSEDYNNLRKRTFKCKKCIWNCHFELDNTFSPFLKFRRLISRDI